MVSPVYICVLTHYDDNKNACPYWRISEPFLEHLVYFHQVWISVVYYSCFVDLYEEKYHFIPQSDDAIAFNMIYIMTNGIKIRIFDNPSCAVMTIAYRDTIQYRVSVFRKDIRNDTTSEISSCLHVVN